MLVIVPLASVILETLTDQQSDSRGLLWLRAAANCGRHYVDHVFDTSSGNFGTRNDEIVNIWKLEGQTTRTL